MLALSATLIMALFAIFFGTRKVDVTEYRSGLMLAVAFESMIKLIALIAVAGLAVFTLFNLPEATTNKVTESIWGHWSDFNFFSFNFIGQSLMAAAAIICLPRQFHVTVVDNQTPLTYRSLGFSAVFTTNSRNDFTYCDCGHSS